MIYILSTPESGHSSNLLFEKSSDHISHINACKKVRQQNITDANFAVLVSNIDPWWNVSIFHQQLQWNKHVKHTKMKAIACVWPLGGNLMPLWELTHLLCRHCRLLPFGGCYLHPTLSPFSLPLFHHLHPGQHWRFRLQEQSQQKHL